MPQAEFAEAFHLPITTLRDWEQHRSTPDAPARALLLAIERDPEVMRQLLADKAAQIVGIVGAKSALSWHHGE
jgi:putative transcriptional regulator